MDDGRVVFVVNPASANGSTRRRWPEIARLAAERGLGGETLFSERPGHAADLAHRAAQDGARLVVAVGGDGTVQGRERPHARGGRAKARAGHDPARYGQGLRAGFRIPAAPKRRSRGPGRRGPHRRRRPRRTTARDGTPRGPTSRTSEERGSAGPSPPGRTRAQGAGRQGIVLLGDDGRLPPVAELGVRGHDRRRAPRWEDARGDRGHRRPTRGRDAPRAARRPQRRPLRHRPHRRRHEGRFRADAAEDLPRHAHPRAEVVKGKRVEIETALRADRAGRRAAGRRPPYSSRRPRSGSESPARRRASRRVRAAASGRAASSRAWPPSPSAASSLAASVPPCHPTRAGKALLEPLDVLAEILELVRGREATPSTARLAPSSSFPLAAIALAAASVTRSFLPSSSTSRVRASSPALERRASVPASVSFDFFFLAMRPPPGSVRSRDDTGAVGALRLRPPEPARAAPACEASPR